MAKGNQQIRQSTPVEEIMGNPPGWIVKWGITMFAVVLALLLMASWLLKFPYIVTARAEITTGNPPVSMVARVSGKISRIFVEDHQKVRVQEILAVMESTAGYQSIEWIDKAIDTLDVESDRHQVSLSLLSHWPEDPGLGEIQESYSDFRRKLLDYTRHIEIDAYGKNMEALQVEIDGIGKYIDQLMVSERLQMEKLAVERSMFERDSSLLSTRTISNLDYDRANQKYLDAKINLNTIRLEKYSREIERSGKIKELEDLRARREEERNLLRSSVEESRSNLRSRIDWWQQNYLMISPIEGFITFTRFWGENQSVKEGEIVMTVVPEDSTEIFARLYLTMKGAGLVTEGLDVNIRLDGYPYLEYGMVRGKIRSISLVPSEGFYHAEVSLPDGLLTFYDRTLEFTQNMSGQADIITEDRRLIERIVYPFRYLIEKNRR